MAQTIFNDEQYKGMPWQVKAIGFVGVPSALLIYMIYAQNVDFKANLHSVRENLGLHSEQTRILIDQNSKLIVTIEQLNRTMDRICSNTAKNTTERNECFR